MDTEVWNEATRGVAVALMMCAVAWVACFGVCAGLLHEPAICWQAAGTVLVLFGMLVEVVEEE